MNVDKPKLILTLIVLFYTAIFSLYIHSYLTGDNPPIFIINHSSGFSLQVLP